MPVMLGFGYVASVISAKATHKILKASGAIVIVLGLIMVNRGLALTGSGYDTKSLVSGFSSENIDVKNSVSMEGEYQVIEMDVTRYGYSPDKFVLKKDVPVKWVINGKELTGCNNAIQVPKYGLEFDLVEGEQVIEFTPTEVGVVSWSCWMGIILGTFIVKENVDDESETYSEPVRKASGSCGGNCGSPTCGASTGGGCGCGGR